MNPMHIDDFTLHEWLDDLLPLPKREEVEAHLISCASCRQKAADLRGIVTLFDDLVDEGALESSPSAGFATNVMAAIEARSLTPARLPWKTLLLQSVVALGLLVLSASLLREMFARWFAQIAPSIWQLSIPSLWSTWRGEMMQWIGEHWSALQQTVGDWAASIQPPHLPDISLVYWLPLLGGSALLWLAATRWMLVTNGQKNTGEAL